MAQRGRGTAAGARAARNRRDAADVAPRNVPRGPDLAALRVRLRELVEPVVVDEGLDLDDLSVSRVGRRFLVRVTVDGDGGIGHDELSDVSRQISVALDEAERDQELTPDAYTLEVSSPGIDRPLTLPRHWRRNIGRLVTVRADGRGLTGRIMAVTETTVTLDVDGTQRELALADLGPGQVQVEFGRLQELSEDEIGDLADDDGVEETEDEA